MTRAHLTELGFGGAQAGNLHTVIDDDTVQQAIDTAWDAGVRYFDTAPHYGLGLSERRLGAALARRPRDDYVLSTKVGRVLTPSPESAHLMDAEGFAVPADSRREWDLTPDGIRRSLDASLNRLALDRIDIAYLHDPDDFPLSTVIPAIETLIELRDEGIVAGVGAGSNFTRMPADLIRNTDVDVMMLAGRFTLLDQEALDELLPLALERGVSVVAAGVYNSGILSRPRPADDALYQYAPADAELRARAVRIAEVCEAHGVTLPCAAVQFPLRHPAVESVVVGLRSSEHVESAATRMSTAIPPSLWTDLAGAGLIRDHVASNER